MFASGLVYRGVIQMRCTIGQTRRSQPSRLCVQGAQSYRAHATDREDLELVAEEPFAQHVVTDQAQLAPGSTSRVAETETAGLSKRMVFFIWLLATATAGGLLLQLPDTRTRLFVAGACAIITFFQYKLDKMMGAN